MFTIDLLKGEGVPAKSRPEGIAVAAVTLAVPVILAIAMLGFYLSDRIGISIQKQDVVKYEAMTSKLADAVGLQESLEKEKNAISSSLSEVSSSIGRHTQWSPVLTTVVENMPDSMVLTSLEVKQRFVKRQVPKKDDPDTMVQISVPQRTLRISVSGRPQHNCGRAVREFRDHLHLSTVLGPKLENITVGEDVDELKGQDVVSYQIDCIFKPGL